MTKPESEVISAALDAMEIAQRMMADAESQIESAVSDLRRAATRYLMEADGENDLRERATYVYWHMPLVPASLIARVMLGSEKSAHRLCAVLTATSTDIECGSCGVAITVSSRSELAEVKRFSKHIGKFGLQESLSTLCGECQAREEARRHERWGEERAAATERAIALRTMPYRDYLLTDEWLETRNRKLRRAKYKCQLCNDGGLLNVHHRTYERRGFEDDADLIVLCHPCHAKFHGKVPY